MGNGTEESMQLPLNVARIIDQAQKKFNIDLETRRP